MENQALFETKIDLRMQIEELERELAVRRDCYPRWIEAGRIDETLARYRIEALEAAIETLRGQKVAP